MWNLWTYYQNKSIWIIIYEAHIFYQTTKFELCFYKCSLYFHLYNLPKQYAGSSEEFWSRFNNYRCSHSKFLRKKKVKQESFHAHFVEGQSDWEVRLIDQGWFLQGESCWKHELETFQPNRLNYPEVALF